MESRFGITQFEGEGIQKFKIFLFEVILFIVTLI